PKGMADMLNSLGRIALLEGDNAEARRCYEQARTLSHNLGDNPVLAAALEGMGNSALALGHYGEARRYFREALQIAIDGILPRIFSIYVGIGELFLQTGRRARGLELLPLALYQTTSDQDTKDRVQQLLRRYQVTPEATRRTVTTVDFAMITAS